MPPDDITQTGTPSAPVPAPQPAALSTPEAQPAAAPSPAPAEAAPAAPAAQPAADDGLTRTPGLLERHDAEQTAAAKKDPEKPTEQPAADAKPVDKPAEPAKPAEAKPAEAPKPAEAAPAQPAAPAAVAYEYKLPDTLKMDDAQRTELHGALDAFRTDPAKGAQAIIDIGSKMMTDYAKSVQDESLRNQFKAFNATKADWEKQIMADREIGGAGHQTALRTIARMRDALVSSAAPGTPQYENDFKAFNEFLAMTGAGSHPAFHRMLYHAAAYIDEPQFDSLPANIQPPADAGRAPRGRGARGVLYDNPRSQQNGS